MKAAPFRIGPFKQQSAENIWEGPAIHARIIRTAYADRAYGASKIAALQGIVPDQGEAIEAYCRDLAVLDAVRCLEGESCDELAATLF